MQKICIMGAGVGGLTTAIELAKTFKYDIYVLERNSDIGGQARSSTVLENGEIKHSEYCWHAIHTGYYYFISMMANVNKHYKLYMKPINKFIYSSPKGQYIEKNNAFLTKYNKFIYGIYKLYGSALLIIRNIIPLILFYINIIAACPKRTEEWDDIKWKDFLSKYNFSPEIMRWLLDSSSIFLGMDYSKLSTHTMATLIRSGINKSYEYDPEYKFYSLKFPMSYFLFDRIIEFFKQTNVHLHTNIEIEEIKTVENKIVGIKCNSPEFDDIFDENTIYVNGMSVESFAKLTDRSDIKKLAEYGYQIQTQVFYYYSDNRATSLPIDGEVIIHYDTPWFLMTRKEESFWLFNISNTAMWSVGIGMWDVPGLNNKIALECTPEELAIECWNQMRTDKKLNLVEWNDTIKWTVWESFKYDEQKSRLTTYEPKWSNSVGTLSLRPRIKDEYLDNLYNATAYTANKTNTFNMEGAAESGTHVAALIQKKQFIENEQVPLFIRFIRSIDNFIFNVLGW
jgi:uncharacterized protein with NAD-binding domain and iron-sulfur cluster